MTTDVQPPEGPPAPANAVFCDDAAQEAADESGGCEGVEVAEGVDPEANIESNWCCL